MTRRSSKPLSTAVFTERLMHGDGSHRTYRSTKFPVRDDAGDDDRHRRGLDRHHGMWMANAALEDAGDAAADYWSKTSPVAIAVTDEAGVSSTSTLPQFGCARCRASTISTDARPSNWWRRVSRTPWRRRWRPSPPWRRTRRRAGRCCSAATDHAARRVHHQPHQICRSECFQVQVRDVTDAIADQQNLLQIANTDALTNA